VDDLRKIRGVFFSPSIVEEVIRAQFPEVVEFETLLTQEEVMPVLTLRVEFSPSIGEGQYKELRSRIKEKLKIRSNLTFEIETVKPGGLPRYTLKSSRLGLDAGSNYIGAPRQTRFKNFTKRTRSTVMGKICFDGEISLWNFLEPNGHIH